MIYTIVKYGDPVLEKKAEPVTVFDEELKKLVDDMFESMYAAHGLTAWDWPHRRSEFPGGSPSST